MFRGKGFDNIMSQYKEIGIKGAAESEMEVLFSDLGRLIDKKVNVYWHMESFKHYLAENINPYGLRVQIFPSLENLEEDFKRKWEENLQTCTKNMMLLLIEEYSKTMKDLDEQIEKMYQKLEPSKITAT